MRRLAILLSLLLVAAALDGQQSDAQRQLAVRRAEISLREAKSALQQKQALHSEGLIPRAELERAEAEYARAQIDTQMNQIGLTNELPTFRIVKAIKSISNGGDITVVLTLEELVQAYVANVERSYLVSLAEEGTIVAEPYQQRISVGRGSRTQALRFHLLRDVNGITVVILSGTRREEIRLLLQRDADDLVRLTCDDCSQEGPLGGRVEYRLSLERFDRRSRVLRFHVAGLPSGFSANIVDTDTRASLTAVRFADTAATKQLVLEVYLPPSIASPAARVIPITVSVVDEGRSKATASVVVQLAPKGTSRLTLSSDNLLLSGTQGLSAATTFVVRNAGTAEATGVILDFESPADIDLTIQPRSIPSLRPQAQARVQVHALISSEAVPGDYSVPIKARTLDRMISVESPELALRISVSRGLTPKWIAGVVVMLLLIGTSAVLFRRFMRS